MHVKLQKKYTENVEKQVVEFLAEETDVSKVKIKKAIGIGGLWIKKANQKSKKRVKKIKTLLSQNDFVEFYFNDQLDQSMEEKAFEIYSGKGFGVWFKPAGLLSDTTPYSDRGCLSYVIKQKYKNCYLIQRLDREVGGVLLAAYNKEKAAFFSKEMKAGNIKKFYQAEVLGNLSGEGVIDKTLDGKECLTKYQVIKENVETTLVEIEILTGRYHQIRRHFDRIQHPIIGDPKYGRGNKNSEGLRLISKKCIFYDPIKKSKVPVAVPESELLF